MTNIVDPERQSKSYASRLAKYRLRGFSLALPGFKNLDQIVWIREAAYDTLFGLAKVIYLNLNGVMKVLNCRYTYTEDRDYDEYECIYPHLKYDYEYQFLIARILCANVSKEVKCSIGNRGNYPVSNPVFDIHISNDIENIIDIDRGFFEVYDSIYSAENLVCDNSGQNRKYPHLSAQFQRKIKFLKKLPHSQVSGSFHPTTEDWYSPFIYANSPSLHK